MGKSVIKRRIPALLLCAVMIVSMMSQGISAVMKAVPAIPAGTEPGYVETISIPAKEAEIEKTAETASDVAEQYPAEEIEMQEVSLFNADSGLYYNLGITPRTAGTVLEDWNYNTRILKLTAVPYMGCSFICWTEFYYDEEEGEERERLIKDADPFNPVYSWYVAESGRTLVANFRKGGEYFIWDAGTYSEKGELEVSPKLESVRPGTEITVKATPFKNYEVVGIEFGYAVEEGFLGSENVEWERISDTDTATFRMPSSDVWVRAVFRSTLPHTVKLICDDSNGTVTFSDGSTTKGIVAGTTVTLTVTPAENYRLKLITGVPEGYDLQTHTFEMPDMDLEIHATFTQLKTYTISFKFTPSTDYGTIVPAYNQETGLFVVAAVPTNSSILFTGWYDEYGNLLSDDFIYTFYPDRDMMLELRFTAGYTIYKANMNHGTFEVYPERVSPLFNDTKSYYKPGETVRLIATPDDGYMLKNYYYVYYNDYSAYQSGQTDLMHKLDGDTITMINDSVIVMAAFVVGYDINAASNNDDAGSALGAGKYEQNTSVTLTAQPKAGYEFVNWTENGTEVSTSAEYTFTATKNRDLVANFRKLVNVTVTASNDSYGTVSGGGEYSPGTSVTVTATPATDCVFVNWTKNGMEVSTSASYTFTAQEDVELVANFRQLDNYTVTVVSSNGEYGTVSGGGTVKEGNSVTVVATPSADCYFVNWTKDGVQVSTSATYTFTPEGNVTLTANFEHVQEFTVSVTSSNTAYGTVSGGGKFKTGESVTVKATSIGDSIFVNWTKNGVEVSTSAEYTFTVQGNVELVANFRALNNYTVDVSSSNDAYGTVTGGGSYKEGTSVTVKATPAADCLFVNWMKDGVEVSTSAEYTFTVQENVTLVANFRALNKYTVTVESSNSEYGTVSGGGSFKEDESVTVTATPSGGCVFVNWTKDGVEVSTSLNYTFTVQEDVTLVANFRAPVQYSVVVQSSNNSYGTVSGGGSFKEGESVTVMATPADGCVFVNWTKDGAEVSTSAAYTFTVQENVTLVANFRELNKYTVTVESSNSEHGTVSGGGTFTEGSDVTVTATPLNDSVFVNWTVNGQTVSASESYTFKVENNVTLVANFKHTAVYVISNEAELRAFSAAVNNGETDACAIMTADIIMSDENWIPIGDGDKKYSGTFDGQGHSIVGLKCTGGNLIIDYKFYMYYAALFGCVGYGGCVKNVTLIDCDIQSHDPYGWRLNVAGIVGMLSDGIISNCHVTGTNNLCATGECAYVGGIAGRISNDYDKKGIIEFCSVTGNTTIKCNTEDDAHEDSDTYAGGIVGDIHSGYVRQCYRDDEGIVSAGASYVRVGGVFGSLYSYGDGSVTDCYSIGDVSAISDGDSVNIGGVGGVAHSYLRYCYSIGKITGAKENAGELAADIGGIIGYSNKGTISDCFYSVDDNPDLNAIGENDNNGCNVNESTVLGLTDSEFTGLLENSDLPEDVWVQGIRSPLLKAFEPYYSLTLYANDGTEAKKTFKFNKFTRSEFTYLINPFESAELIFTGWNTEADGSGMALSEMNELTGDIELYAQWRAVKYGITFVNDDGTVLQSTDVAYGETPVYTGQTPTKDADAQYTYTFAGWDPEITAVTGEATYTATYNATVNEYTVTFKDEDGTELQSGTVPYGETPAYTAEMPTKQPDAEFTYFFAGWSPEITPVTGDATYTATYSSTVNDYMVTFADEDGTVLQSGMVKYGETPEYKGETPTKAADAQYTYTFAGWKPGISAVTGEVTYTATYSATVNEYTVEFINEDGVVLQSGMVKYGETPEYKGETPTKAADAQYTYAFAGWSPEIAAVTGDATYTATYGSTVNTYEITFSVNGATETVTAAYGDTITAPADPVVEGNDFTGWFTDAECTVPADLTQPVTGSATFYAGFEGIVYTIEGSAAWSADDMQDINLTVHRNRRDEDTFDLFKGLIFDGEEVDPSFYTAEPGSVKLTVKSELFEEMPSGTYDLVVVFNDGTVTTKVTIKQKSVAPPTGEPVQIAVCATLALTSLAAFLVIARKIRRGKADY